LTFYRRAIEIRHCRTEFGGLTVEWLDSPPDVLVFRLSSGLVCALNAGSGAVALPSGEVLLASGPLVDGQLPPDTAAWLV
jgi:alpha-glucosidase